MVILAVLQKSDGLDAVELVALPPLERRDEEEVRGVYFRGKIGRMYCVVGDGGYGRAGTGPVTARECPAHGNAAVPQHERAEHSAVAGARVSSGGAQDADADGVVLPGGRFPVCAANEALNLRVVSE